MIMHYPNGYQVITETRRKIAKFHCVGFVWQVKDDRLPHIAILHCKLKEGNRKDRQKGIL